MKLGQTVFVLQSNNQVKKCRYAGKMDAYHYVTINDDRLVGVYPYSDNKLYETEKEAVEVGKQRQIERFQDEVKKHRKYIKESRIYLSKALKELETLGVTE